jgi:superoxide dismutase, Fe-Mn family
MMTRREAIQTTVLLTAAATALPSARTLAAAAPAAPEGPHKLAPLPYAVDALEPHIDAQTMTIHHGRHHQAYVTNLNKALAGQDALAKKSVAELVRELNQVPESIRAAVRNQGGGHYNHELFWQMMKKGGGGQPKGALARSIDEAFGSFDGFKTQFTDAAMKAFGSAWAWLVVANGKLAVVSRPNQDTPYSEGMQVLLGVDVWEHAYYLKYQNKRADYVAAFFNVVDWDFVAERHARAKA